MQEKLFLFPIGSLGELLVPIGPLFQLQYNSKLIGGPHINMKILAWLEYVWPVTEIYSSIDEVI
jgi:hypothetical protein